jgi:hypothetical protein
MVAMATTTLVADSGLSRCSFLIGLGYGLGHAHDHGLEAVLGTLPSSLCRRAFLC